MIDSWQLKQILKLYIYFVVKTTSSVKLFEVTVQKFHNGWNDFIAHVFVYKLCLQLCFSERWKKASRNLSHFKKELRIENKRPS